MQHERVVQHRADPQDLVCSDNHSVCTPKCTMNTDCSTGDHCALTRGQCTTQCESDTDCITGQRCDLATRQCKESGGGTGTPCTGEGLSTCAYGTHFCGSARCTPLPAPACPNYTNFQSPDRLGTTSRILYNARLVSAAMDTTACGTTHSKRVKIALSAYSNDPFPSAKDALSGFFFVGPSGLDTDGNRLVFSGSDYVVSGTDRKRAEITVSLCLDPASTTFSTAFYFVAGNFLCYQASY